MNHECVGNFLVNQSKSNMDCMGMVGSASMGRCQIEDVVIDPSFGVDCGDALI